MTTARFALALTGLALCRLAAAQGQPAAPAAAPLVAPAATMAPAAEPSPAALAEEALRPRLLRGNDRVIATPPPAVPLAGSATAFRFEDAPIVDVVQVLLRDILKVDYVLHPPIAGTVTLATRGDVTPDQAVFLLEGALLANGLVMARDSRGTYHVGRPEALRGIVSAPRQAGGPGPLPPGYGAVVVPLEYIGANEMATILRPMLPPDALVRVDPLRNLLVLVGSRTQAEGWLSIVQTFDVDLLKGMSVGLFPLKYASAREIEVALRLISPGGRPAAAAAAPAAGGSAPAEAAPLPDNYPLFGAVRVMPIERLNSVLVVSPKAAYLDEARRWIERLDQPGLNSGEQRLHVYPVQNGSARHLADVLNGIFGNEPRAAASPAASGVAPGLNATMGATGGFAGGLAAGQGNASPLGGMGGLGGGSQAGQAAGGRPGTSASAGAFNAGGVRVVPDEVNNAILVWGTALDFAKIESTMRRLDIPPTQVLIEASIVEVTLSDDLEYGLQWTFNNGIAGGKGGTSVLSNLDNGIVGGALAGFSYTLRNSLGNVRAVLNALADRSLVKVISSPSLMVLDNHTAQISVGDQQPIRSTETITSGGNVSSSIQYKDTGVALAVTPSVNAGNMVTMTVNQAVTDVGQIDGATGQRSFLQRQFTSKVAIRSGETLVLGGLIRDNTTTGSNGLPVLHEVPVFGALFGNKRANTRRTELLVIITPRVVRSEQDARDVSNELRERMKSFTGHAPFGVHTPAPVFPGAAPVLPR